MASTQTSYVRTQMIAAEPPPPGVTGVAHWLKTNLFATTKDTILTVIALLLLARVRRMASGMRTNAIGA